MIKHIGRKKCNLIVIVCEGGMNTLKYTLFEKTLTNDGQNISFFLSLHTHKEFSTYSSIYVFFT